MADILANPVDICFSSMLAKSTTPAACLIIEGNAVTTNQQIRTDLLTETHPPTPSDLIAGINRVEGMLFDTIKICERVKRPRRTSTPSSMPLGLCNAAHVASGYIKRKIQIEYGPKTPDRGSYRSHLDKPYPIHENFQTHGVPVPCPQEVSSTSHYGPSPSVEPRTVPGPSRILDRLHNYLPELSRRRDRDPRLREVGCLCRCTTSRWRDR
jgi:hypothetical protein